MSSSGYISRIVDAELKQLLRSAGAVVVEGPKACGKTATARRLAASEVLLDTDDGAREAAEIEPSLVFPGETPRLIDEWQVVETMWNRLRREIDDRARPGQFILTGSAVPTDDATRHSGAMRIVRLRMRPLSLFEAGRSTGTVSLRALLDGEPAPPAPGELNVAELATEIGTGGWPSLRAQGLAPDEALQSLRGYIDEIRRTDIRRVDGVRRDPDRVLRLLQSLARNVATYVTDTTLGMDTAGESGSAIDRATVADYLAALRRLFVIEDQPAWAPHLRSRYQLRRSPKRHFVDPSLAVAALRSTPERALADIKLFGFLFESLVVRDLRVYAQAADAEVRQYRDNSGLEIDAVVQAADGRWAAFEVKLGVGQVDAAAEALRRFASQIDTGATGELGALGVIVGSGYAYTRDDGVCVIPITTLGP